MCLAAHFVRPAVNVDIHHSQICLQTHTTFTGHNLVNKVNRVISLRHHQTFLKVHFDVDELLMVFDKEQNSSARIVGWMHDCLAVSKKKSFND